MRRISAFALFFVLSLPACGSSPSKTGGDGGSPSGTDAGTPRDDAGADGAVDSGAPDAAGDSSAPDAAGDSSAPDAAVDDGGSSTCNLTLCASPGEDVCQDNAGYICVGQPGGCLTLSPIDVCTSDQACFEGQCNCAPNGCTTVGNGCTAAALVACTLASDGCLVAGPPTPCTTSMPNATPSCSAGACSVACNPGYVLVGTTCTATPQLVSPLSTARVTSTTPTLHWILPSGADGASVDVCRDRACGTVVTTLGATGTSVRLSSALAPGAYFWRARGTSGGTATTPNSATWEFWVGWPGESADTSWGSVLDVNGDGFADIAVADVVTIPVYVGSASGLSLAPGTPPSFPATLLVNAGDVNGDGFGDLLASSSQSGAALLFLGSATGLIPEPVAELAGNASNVATTLYDANHDGFADVALGYRLDGKPPTSRVDIYPGSPASLAAKPAASLSVPGSITAVAGCDFNGDGAGDLAVSADGASSASVAVFLGGAAGLSSTAAATLTPATPNHLFAATLACAGDVNADGFEDLLAGDPGDPGGGVVFLYLGSSTGISSTPTMLGNAGGTLLGQALAGAGDVNGDGFDDALVGAAGDANVLLGSASGVSFAGASAFTTLSLDGGAPTRFGAVLGGAGDVNGDGYSDVVVGAPIKPFGKVLVYAGSSAGPSASRVEILVSEDDAGVGFGSVLAGIAARHAVEAR
jgi:hypothetical protein